MELFQSSTTYILDSWPLVEWAQGLQSATSHIDVLLEAAFQQKVSLYISRINYGEILYCCKKYLGNRYLAARADVQALPIDVLSIDDMLVDQAADLKSIYPISYADCFAAALAIGYQVPIVTGDSDFRLLQKDKLLQVEWVGA